MKTNPKVIGRCLSWFSTFLIFENLTKVLGVVLNGSSFQFGFHPIWKPHGFQPKNQLENLANFQVACESYPTLVKTTSWANFSNSPKVKLVRNLNKLSVVCMVVRMSKTLYIGVDQFSIFSSSSIDVKYSQMLTQAIVACTMISSSATIYSSNSSSLLEELKSRCVKINSIDDKWNEP